MTRRAALLVLPALLAGCVLGPGYKRPDLALPEHFHRASPDAAVTAESIADLPWWRLFDDARLVALIEEALRANLDIELAAAQVAEAQALVAVARSPLFPQLGGQVEATRGNQNVTRTTTNSFLAALALSWELDFWGRYRRATESARATLLASEEGRRAVIASLVAAVAQQYLELVALRRRLEIVTHTAEAQRESLRLVQQLSKQGVQSAAEEWQAQSQLLATQAQVPALERQIAQAQDTLAVLLGSVPRDFDVGTRLPDLALPSQVPAGLPSALLERRADVRQAEQQLVAANAEIGVARAMFFPSISLTGLFGRASDSLRGIVSNGGTNVGAAGATANVPLFTGGANTGNYEAARARAAQAVALYRRTVLVALQDVSSALAAYDRDGAEVEINRRRVEASGESLRLANQRFRAGVISFLEVLDAQRQRLAAELDLNASELSLRLSAVVLYKALGGGWSPQDR